MSLHINYWNLEAGLETGWVLAAISEAQELRKLAEDNPRAPGATDVAEACRKAVDFLDHGTQMYEFHLNNDDHNPELGLLCEGCLAANTEVEIGLDWLNSVRVWQPQ